MAERKKGAGGKLSRSEIVTVRFDPRIHFGAELAAARQRRTLSSFIEGAVEAQLEHVKAGPNLSVAQVLEDVWSTDPVVRFVRLAFRYPQLLTHEQLQLWEFICSYDVLWKGHWEGAYWVWRVHAPALILPRLRQYWETIEKVATGELDRSALPRRRKPRFLPVRQMSREEKAALRRQLHEEEALSQEDLRQEASVDDFPEALNRSEEEPLLEESIDDLEDRYWQTSDSVEEDELELPPGPGKEIKKS